jgi:hypothetical protein
MVPKINEMKGISRSGTGWDLVVDSKNDMIKIETKRSIRGIIMMRASGPIDWPPIDVRRCMQYRPMRREWDLNCDETKTLKKYGANAYVVYKKTMKKFVIAPREFVANQIMN